MQNDLRAALHYVPRFRGKTFVLGIDVERMPEMAVAEATLDLAALQEVGLRLVLVSLGNRQEVVEDWLVDGEIRWEHAEAGASPTKVREILERGQMVVVDGADWDPLGSEMVDFCLGLGAAKLIVFLPEAAGGEEVIHGMSREVALRQGGLLARAAEVCGAGVPRVHLLDERRQGVLMDELFSNEGVGVMIHADDYRRVRPLAEEDIPELLAMIGRSMRQSHLVPRNYEEIANARGDFLVLTVDDHVVGCVALHPYPEEAIGEVGCLYVKQSHEHLGYGQELVRAAEQKARALGFERVFALTNRARQYFQKSLGYELASVDDIPLSRRKKLEASGRGSEVLSRPLNSPQL